MTTVGLVLNLVFSCIGGGYALYGRKQHKSIALISGVLLMFYGYFIDNISALFIIGLVLSIVPWLWRE